LLFHHLLATTNEKKNYNNNNKIKTQSVMKWCYFPFKGKWFYVPSVTGDMYTEEEVKFIAFICVVRFTQLVVSVCYNSTAVCSSDMKSFLRANVVAAVVVVIIGVFIGWVFVLIVALALEWNWYL
jgi:fucose permease